MQHLLAKLPAEVKRWEFSLILLLVLVALVPRLLFLTASGFSIESDEAIVGLMAKHIRDGAQIPVFYYGQHYMGSLEALLVAALFSLLGESSQTLKLVPLIFSLLHVALIYLLTRRFVRWQFAAIAGLLTAMAPATLLLWSAKARGGFIELVVIGTLALILAVDCLTPKSQTRARLWALGFVLGVGWWVNNQIIFYMLPIATVFLFYFPRQLGFLASIRFALIALFGFFVGSAPFWYANLFLTPRFATFEVLFGSSAGGNLWRYLRGFFDTALPIIIGARRFWSEQDVIPAASLIMLSLYGVVVLSLILLRSKDGRNNYAAIAMLVMFCITVPLAFSASRFGWLSKAPRYLLPLYSVLFVLVALAIERLWDNRYRWLAALVGVLLLVGHGISSFWGGVAIAGQPIVFRNQRVAESHTELYRWLAANNYSHIHTNYWIGYRVAFETDEKITFTRYGHPKTLRIPEYERQARLKQLPKVYVLVPAEAKLLEQELQQFGYKFSRTVVGSYVVIDSVSPAWPRAEQIEIKPEQVEVFNRPEQRKNLFDADVTTRWGSGMPQHPAMELRINLPIVQSVTAIELEFGTFVHDAPRDLEVLGVRSDGEEVSLFRLFGTKTYYELQAQATSEVEPIWSIYFKPEQLRSIILRQHGVTKLFDWSIAELRLYRSSE